MNPIYLHLTSAPASADELIIRGAQYHHLTHVRRVRVGAPLRAALPDGRVLRAEVTAITAEALHARVLGEEAPVSETSSCRIILCQAVLKGDKMELVVQKATELGVDTLIPLLAARSIPRWSTEQGEERAHRWQQIANAAADQSERNRALSVESPCTLAEVPAHPGALRLLLHEREGAALREIAAQHPLVPALELFLGPEGGWDPGEVERLLATGALPIHLGPRILRAETASVVAVTLAQFLWGDIG